MSDAKFAVILPAAGSSTRYGGKEKKPFLSLDGRAVWLRAAEVFATREDVVQMIVAIAPADRELFETRYTANAAFLNIQVVEGGAERYESIRNAIAKLSDEVTHVAVHDAVRPCITTSLVDRVFRAAIQHGAAVPGIPIADTIKRVNNQLQVQETIARTGLWGAQTPQTFRRDWFEEAYQKLDTKLGITDDAQLIELAGHPVTMLSGDPKNIKITTPEDMQLAELYVRNRPADSKSSRFTNPFDESWMK